MSIFYKLPDIIPKWPHRSFLIFGEWPALWTEFIKVGFKGVAVVPASSKLPPDDPTWPGLDMLKVNVAIEGQFQKRLTGEWVKTVSVQEIFFKFPGPYDLIAINVPMQTRKIWWSDEVQAALPAVYLTPEDSHNEYVIERGVERGYKPMPLDHELLIMVHK